MVVYLLSMVVISWLGSEKFGGLNIIKYGWDMLLITVLSLFFYAWALKSGIESESLDEGRKVNDALRAAQKERANEK